MVENFISEYGAGKTPNPCVRCNTFLKWGALWRKKEELELDYIATGHYARIIRESDETGLYRAKNLRKDQSYALWGIPYDRLKYTIFPLGEMTKTEVRRLAASWGLKTAHKPESQEICFIPDDDYPSFLKSAGLSAIPGEIVDEKGRVVGEHSGYIYYTIGQRKRLGGGFAQPMYVNRIDPEENKIYIGPRSKLMRREITVENVNWLRPQILMEKFNATVKIRYADPGRNAQVIPQTKNRLKIIFSQGVSAPAPGQSAVVYCGDRVICGGIISVD